MIELAGVSKRYGATTALSSLSIRFGDHETTALIGPSGCGKSTLLRMIVGLVEPDTGVVEVDGERLTARTEQQIRRKIGYVIQDGGLFPHWTCRQNVVVMAAHLKTPPADIEQRVRELCEVTRLPAEMLDRYPAELSGGQRQRVGLMRALMLRPNILLLDEPLAALDPLVRSALQDDLKRLFETFGQTVVMVTHDMGEAAYLAGRIVLMREGSIVQDGSLEDFQIRPAEPFVAEFLNAQRRLVAL